MAQKKIEDVLKDAGLVAADAAGQVDSSDVIVDLGAGLVEGHLVTAQGKALARGHRVGALTLERRGSGDSEKDEK